MGKDGRCILAIEIGNWKRGYQKLRSLINQPSKRDRGDRNVRVERERSYRRPRDVEWRLIQETRNLTVRWYGQASDFGIGSSGVREKVANHRRRLIWVGDG